MSDPFPPVVQLTDLGPRASEPIGKGGQASVTALAGHGGWVFKQYNSRTQVDAPSLDRLVEWRRDLKESERKPLDDGCCWPVSRVEDGATTVGVLLHQLPDRFMATLDTGTTRPRKLDFLYITHAAQKVGIPTPHPPDRAQILADLAELLELFDRHQIAHGDVSMNNVIWRSPGDGAPAAYLLDCDGASLDGRPRALKLVATPGWADPFAGTSGPGGRSIDVYDMGLAYYHCYYLESRGRDQDADKLRLPVWPPATPELIKLAASSLGKPGGRPPIGQWVAELRRLARDLNDPTSDLGNEYAVGYDEAESAKKRQQQQTTRSAPRAPTGRTPHRAPGRAAPHGTPAAPTTPIPIPAPALAHLTPAAALSSSSAPTTYKPPGAPMAGQSSVGSSPTVAPLSTPNDRRTPRLASAAVGSLIGLLLAIWIITQYLT